MVRSDAEFFLCPKCFTVGRKSGPCPNCGASVLHCKPGDPDDPCRKPLMDARGEVRTRAPLWWLIKNIPELARFYESK